MTKQQGLKLSTIALAALMVIGCNSTNPTNAPQVSPEGMELKKSTSSTIAYKKEGIDFSEYDKVQILPSAVAFKKNWKRDYNREQTSLSNNLATSDFIRMTSASLTLVDNDVCSLL